MNNQIPSTKNNVDIKREKTLMAQDENQKWNIWESALKTGELSLKDTLIRENMEYLGWTKEQVIECWGEKGSEKIKEKWLKENPKTEQEITHYYNTLKLYIPELSSWHAMEKNIDFIKIIEFLQLSIKQGFTKYMDFGAGIGSNGILFNEYGFSVTLADISDEMTNYEKWRLGKHNVKANFIDLKTQELPDNTFDCASAIEVLEHVVDPVGTMNKIRKSLVVGGHIFVTTPFHNDPERPQHIVHDMKVVKQFEELGMELVSQTDDGLYRILKKI